MTSSERLDRKGYSIAELSQKTGLSRATIARHTSRTRAEWLEEKAQEREKIRAYHDDQGHSWTETAEFFGLHRDTVLRRARRARKERATETETHHN